MQILKRRILFLISFFIFFTSCEKNEYVAEDHGSDQGSGEVEKPQTPETPESEDLKLMLDLAATIKSDNGENKLKYHFDENVSAVVFIRSTADDLIYLPVSMIRTEANPQSVEVRGVDVAFDKLKADASKKWQLKLVIGGTWDANTKHVEFGVPSNFAPSEKKDVIVFNQPYMSSWQEIPTNEKGQFVTSGKDNTHLEVEVTTPAITLVHHIVSCEAEADVAISKMKLTAGPLAFSGYFDFSDPKTLKTDSEPQWHIQSDASRCLEMDFTTPITVKPGKEEPLDDYIYLWAMLSESEHNKISVQASGRVNNKAKEEFTELSIFDAEFNRPTANLYPIDSKVHIEYTPEISGPITLTTVDDKKTLIANDIDKVTFVVTQSDVDVTDESKIYKEVVSGIMNEELEGVEFKTTRPGRYVFYAEKDGQRSDYFVINATEEELVDPDGNIINGTLFCPNVTLASGWHDVNKVGNGNSPQDGLLCWAAVASNMLQWWLDDFKNKGNELPERVPYGPGKLYRLAIFDTFYNTWVNYMYSTAPAIRWFMEGGGMKWGANNGSNPNKGGVVHDGGYFRGVLPQDLENRLLGSEYVKEYGAYYSWGYPEDPELQKYPTRIERFSHLIKSILKHGPTALSIDSHELTLWGCDIQNGIVKKVYVTNSDDGGNPRITSYDVIVKKDWIHLKDYPGKTNNPTEVIKLTTLKEYPF